MRLWGWCIAILLCCVGCAQREAAPGKAIQDLLLVNGFDTQLLENIELRPQAMKGRTLSSRSPGPLRRLGGMLAWVDPAVGIQLVDISKPVTRRPVDPTPLALLTPVQQPAEVALFPAAVVVRSKQGPFALELFVRSGAAPAASTIDAPEPDEPAGEGLPLSAYADFAEQADWRWAGAWQRGHYDAIFAAAHNWVLAWDRENARLDCWSVDTAKGALVSVWQWTCPADVDALTVEGDRLALSLHNSAFQVGARSKLGSGVALYALEEGTAGPILSDRWLAPHAEPLTDLLWYGQGLWASQGVTLYLLHRTERGRLALLSSVDAAEHLRPVESAGRFAWCTTTTGVQVVDLKNPRNLVLLTGNQEPLTARTPFVVHRQALWYLADEPPVAADTAAFAALDFGDHEGTQFAHPVTELRAMRLTSREDQAFRHAIPNPKLPPPLPADIALYEGYAYVPRGALGVSVYKLGPDLSDPLAGATEFTTLKTVGEVQQIAIQGHWAYLTNYSAGFQYIDLRNPAAPRMVPHREYYREGTGFLALQGRRVLAAGDILTISRITQPGVIFVDLRFEIPAPAEGLAVQQNRTYVSCGNEGILMLDTSEGHPIVILNQLRTGHHFGRIAVHERVLYAVQERTKVAVFGVERATNPELLQVLDIGATVTALTVSGAELLVGVRTADGGGELRGYLRRPDGTLEWRTSRRLPGPPATIRPATGDTPALAVWSRTEGESGIWSIRPTTAARLRVIGPLVVPAAPGPWLANGARFWSTTDTILTLSDITQSAPQVLAQHDFVLEPTIWPDKSSRPIQEARLMDTGLGALAVIRKGWVHLRLTDYGTIATDPWPLTATEHVLTARDGRALVWDHGALNYQVFQLQPDNAPLPLLTQNWSGTHPEGGGAWEVLGGAIAPIGDGVYAPSEAPVTFATAAAFGGATLYSNGAIVDRIADLQTQAVAIAPDGSWVAAGELITPGRLPRAQAIVRKEGATLATIDLPGVPRKLLFPEPGVLLALWDWGLTVCWGPDDQETFAGRIEDVQLGAGWGSGGPREVLLRFSGQPEWWVVQVE